MSESDRIFEALMDLKGSASAIEAKLDEFSKRLDRHDTRHGETDKRLDVVEADIAKVRTVGGFVAATAGLGATILGIWHTLRGE